MTKLKIGDNVVMNDRYYDKHQGEVFTIKAGPEMIGRKECFWLDGYDGAYCADGLDLYKPPTNEEWLRQCTTEQLAEFMGDIWGRGYLTSHFEGNLKFGKKQDKAYWKMWLKQPHKPIS